MSVSSSIQACLEFASAALISSGFATESNGGRFPRMIVKFAARVAEIGEVRSCFRTRAHALSEPGAPSTDNEDGALALMALSRS